jgi:hypothetical protein
MSFRETPPVGPDKDSTFPAEDRTPGPGRRPRTRCCLLKGCKRRFRPRRAGQRYCSDECRRKARRWSRWKAQQSYRATAAGKERRNGQSRRYRQRVRNRPPAAPEQAVPEAARVITHNFFRPLLRPAWLLRGIRPAATLTPPAVLFARVPARHGTSVATRAPLAPRDATAVEDMSQNGAPISRTY